MRAIELLKDKQSSIEWWALLVGVCCKQVKDSVDRGDARGASLYAIRLSMAWSMLVFLRDLEEHVWTGYNQNQLIYGIAQAGAQTPAQAQAIEALQPLFKSISEDVLHAWVNAGVDIGPRIGVRDVDEHLLKALAEFHLSQFARSRTEEQFARDTRRKTWTIVVGAFGAGAAVATAVVATLAAVGLV